MPELEDGGAFVGALPPCAVGEERGGRERLVPEEALGGVRIGVEEVGEDGGGALRGKEEEDGRGWWYGWSERC